VTFFALGGVLAAVLVASPAGRVPELLHDGRFDASEALLAAVPDSESDSEVLFFRAFVTYWRLIYLADDGALRTRLEAQLAATIRSTENRPARGPSDDLWAGTSHLLRSQLRALEKKPLAAAFEARRARKHLQALSAPTGLEAEGLFGLGTYNYMADRLPAFVKGLRSLLFLPPGDHKLGLAQLERAGRESRHFAVEARLLLATIYANRHERRFDAALEQAALARAASSESLVAVHTSARLLVSLARPEEAARLLDRALARAREWPDADAAVVGTLELLRARADFSMFRPDLAAARADELFAKTGRLPAGLRDDARSLADAARSIVARPWWPDAGAAPPSPERDAVAALMEGRAALAGGDPAGALERLSFAEDSGSLPAPWLGPCRLLAGQAADLLGLRPRALGYYRRAAESPGFLARDAALALQAHPYAAGTP
jgi:hypothetical protein